MLFQGSNIGGWRRFLLTTGAVAFLVPASWAQPSPTDETVKFFQARISKDPDDFTNYDRLGAAYLQKGGRAAISPITSWRKNPCAKPWRWPAKKKKKQCRRNSISRRHCSQSTGSRSRWLWLKERWPANPGQLPATPYWVTLTWRLANMSALRKLIAS